MFNEILRQRYGSGEARALYELIMEQRFGLTRTDILLGKDTTLSAEDKAELENIIERVAKGEPVQYVLGCAEFCGRTFLVGPGVLIPRPETQQLVHLVEQNVSPGSTVLDVGTGSGCIAITLALAGYKVTALDISDVALSFARQNADRLGADVEFVKQDILALKTLSNSPLKGEKQGEVSTKEASPLRGGLVGSIVSNPPYICKKEASTMDDNVLLHEPHLALFVPDDDPLLFYRLISEFGQSHLSAGGHIFFEVNRAYATEVEELLLAKGYEETQIVKDQYDNERFVWARKRQDN
ncbi:MAG: peptide chain release factor N(5)-glutamine methyltransferase [Bacteroidaceae bacterium]|nr:peptide chain release factor N(5)-glutamine methyltransferase [Bacteroidaceae bacterium]MBQ9294638.1 peptide chain release factor N(5)-glutamine methyltransferase [Bacteroidaceae bacterium]